MKKNIFNICFSADNNYMEQLAVSIVSILKNSLENEAFNFYVLNSGIDIENKEKIEQLKKIKDFNIEYVSIDSEEFKNCKLLNKTEKNMAHYHVTLPTYFRYKVGSLFPNVSKLLYIDCDVIVEKSLKPLFDTDLKDNYCAMVLDAESENESERLKIKKYFNAGMMLINLDLWRQDNLEKKLFEYTEKNADTILWQDQDVINVICNNKIKELGSEWNFQFFLYRFDDYYKLVQKLKDVSILHLAGRFKPWIEPFEHPIFNEYYFYLGLTPWADLIKSYKYRSFGKYLDGNIGGNNKYIQTRTSLQSKEDVTKQIDEKVNSLYSDIDNNFEKKNRYKFIETIKTIEEELAKKQEELQSSFNKQLSSIKDKQTKQENIKVSIIIPFNNVQDYIEKCLTSVVNQTLKETEIICINDNSTDNSLNIVNDFANKDSRIKVINLDKQAGQGYARNIGIKLAQGEYIGFVDSDDWVNETMFEKLYQRAKELDSDISMCKTVLFDENNKEEVYSDYYQLDELNAVINKSFNAEETKEHILGINCAIWNKIYKRDFIDNKNILFPMGYIYEDLPFFFETYLNAKNMSIVDDNLYYYRINRIGSTMATIGKKTCDRVDMIKLAYTHIKQFASFKEIQKIIEKWLMEDLYYRATLIESEYFEDFYYKTKAFFQKIGFTSKNNIQASEIDVYDGILFWLEETPQYAFTLIKIVSLIGNKIEDIYNEISKNYEFTKTEIANNVNDAKDFLIRDTDIKIDKVYKEISNNYEFTKSEIANNVNDAKNFLISDTDKKIDKVYNEIANNYEFTKSEISKSIQQTKDSLSGDTDKKINKIYSEITNNFLLNKQLLEEKQEKIKQELQSKINQFEQLSTENSEEIKRGVCSILEHIKTNNDKIFETINEYNEKQTKDFLEELDKTKTRIISEIIQPELEELKTEIKTIKDNELKNIKEAAENEINNAKSLISDTINQLNGELAKQQRSQQLDFEKQILDMEMKFKELNKTLNPVISIVKKFSKDKKVLKNKTDERIR